MSFRTNNRTTAHFPTWMVDAQAAVEAALEAGLPDARHVPSRLHQAMRYATLGGGKRVRPLLVLAAGELTGAAGDALMPVACAVEMIHVYSLVHDDLPCMDDDDLRRGRPTCHLAYDEATALLVGDALQSEAFSLLCRNDGVDADRRLELVALLAQAAGSRGMAGGQAIDLAAVGRVLEQPELELMHAMKTGAMIRAAVLMGAGCGEPLSAEARERLDHYAKGVGLLFQVVDDILDCTASTATLGKTAGKDAAAAKPTYVSILGLDEARRLAGELRGDAMNTLAALGEKTRRLRELTAFIADRGF